MILFGELLVRWAHVYRCPPGQADILCWSYRTGGNALIEKQNKNWKNKMGAPCAERGTKGDRGLQRRIVLNPVLGG